MIVCYSNLINRYAEYVSVKSVVVADIGSCGKCIINLKISNTIKILYMVYSHMLEISPAHPFEIAFVLGQVISIKVHKKFFTGNYYIAYISESLAIQLHCTY